MLTDGRTEGVTDMTRPIVIFRNFVNVPKKRIKDSFAPLMLFRDIKTVCSQNKERTNRG